MSIRTFLKENNNSFLSFNIWIFFVQSMFNIPPTSTAKCGKSDHSCCHPFARIERQDVGFAHWAREESRTWDSDVHFWPEWISFSLLNETLKGKKRKRKKKELKWINSQNFNKSLQMKAMKEMSMKEKWKDILKKGKRKI